MQPLVTVVIPTYNRREYLPGALKSVRNQTYRNLEIIVVDDGSTDGTDAMLKREQGIMFLRQQNSGPSAARNTGIGAARGEFVAFLDSDDYWLPHKIELQMGRMLKNQRLGIVGCASFICDREGRIIGSNKAEIA